MSWLPRPKECNQSIFETYSTDVTPERDDRYLPQYTAKTDTFPYQPVITPRHNHPLVQSQEYEHMMMYQQQQQQQQPQPNYSYVTPHHHKKMTSSPSSSKVQQEMITLRNNDRFNCTAMIGVRPKFSATTANDAIHQHHTDTSLQSGYFRPAASHAAPSILGTFSQAKRFTIAPWDEAIQTARKEMASKINKSKSPGPSAYTPVYSFEAKKSILLNK
eukprot:PhF_6_TR24423/c0_g1_i1/m.33783